MRTAAYIFAGVCLWGAIGLVVMVREAFHIGNTWIKTKIFFLGPVAWVAAIAAWWTDRKIK